MAKANYEKVEERLTQGLLKMMIDNLLELAPAIKPATPGSSGKKEAAAEAREAVRKKVLQALHRDLKRLEKKDSAVIERLGITKGEMKKFVEEPQNLSPEDWQKIKQMKGQIETYKKDMLAPVEKNMDADIIESERRKHKNKRFNVRDGWLPLH